MWINKGWAVRDTEQVLLLLFLPVKWFQVQHMKEHLSLNFPHCECASLKDKGWQTLIHAKINDSLFKRWISNQPFHHWWLPPLFHLHPESSGGKTKQNKTDLSAMDLRQKWTPSKKGQSNFCQMSVMGRKPWKKSGQSGHELMCIWWELQRDRHKYQEGMS